MRQPVPHIAALKIWMAGVLLGPVLMIIGLSVYEWHTAGSRSIFLRSDDIFYLYTLMVLYGGLFSLPSALALWLIILLQYRSTQNGSTFWLTILTATFLLTTVPFSFLGDNTALVGWAAAYLGAIWTGVFWTFYEPGKNPEPEANEPLDKNV